MAYRSGKGRNTPSPGEGKFSPGFGEQIHIGTGKHGIQTVLILSEPAVEEMPSEEKLSEDEALTFSAAFERNVKP